MFEIVAREDFSDVTYLLEVSHPALAKAARPGQFVLVIAHEHAERIPLTIKTHDLRVGYSGDCVLVNPLRFNGAARELI